VAKKKRTTDSDYEFIIVGAGLAGTTAAEMLRHEGAQGSILLLSEETQPPYERPPLSKALLTKDREPPPVAILGGTSFQELKIELRLSTRVRSLDTHSRSLLTSTAHRLRYKSLLIATGASPIRLNLPGEARPGIHYLRTLDDARAIRASAQKSRRAVVIGGSFIGLEVAASLLSMGVHVTLLERGSLFAQFKTQSISEFFYRRFVQKGAQVLLGDAPPAFNGRRRVAAVHTERGKILECDMLVIGAGVAPNIEFLQGSGLEMSDGIIVDRFLQTNRPHVFAAGDVACFFDQIAGRHRRGEHWDNAVKQGRLAARNMLGMRIPYQEVSYFFSQIFDTSFNLLGEIEEHHERIDRGSLDEGSFAAFYLQDDVPRALFSLGRPSRETRLVETLIKHRVNLRTRKSRLSDPNFTLQDIPTQTLFILQGGGAYGAFECGAVKALQDASVQPDIVAGVSIGAFNAAIIASNPDHTAQTLQAFWDDLAIPTTKAIDASTRQWLAGLQIALFGVPSFFRPRWLQPMLAPSQWPVNWTSLYDTSPMRDLLLKYVDFGRLRSSPIRLIVSAVDIESSELVVFDSYVDDLKPEHILASGSLPPAFPWTSIGDKHYWDGGIISNSPLERVLERCGSAGKRVFIIDLFPGRRRQLPSNLAEVMSRQDEILYSERLRNDVRTRHLVREFQKLVNDLMIELPEDTLQRLRHQPRYIQMMAEEAPMAITRIERKVSAGEPLSREYDFSSATLDELAASGYRTAREAIQSALLNLRER